LKKDRKGRAPTKQSSRKLSSFSPRELASVKLARNKKEWQIFALDEAE
jgi:hypothetical protein